MKTTEIPAAIANLRYYAQEIDKAAREQLDKDCKLLEINVNVGTSRFNALGAIGSACNWIDIYCDNILANLETVKATEKTLLQIEETSNDAQTS